MICEVLAVLAGALAPVNVQFQSLGVIRGQVVDSLDRPLEAVQVTVNPGNETLFTTEAGRFRFTRLIAGNHTLTLRRPGYAPIDTLLYASPEEREPDVIRMRALPTLLPEVEVSAGMPEPPHRLTLSTNTGKGAITRGTVQPLSFGAAMTDDAAALILFHGPKTSPNRVSLRRWYDPMGDGYHEFAYGGACQGESGALATRIEQRGYLTSWVLDAALRVHVGVWVGQGECTSSQLIALPGTIAGAASAEAGWIVYRTVPPEQGRLTYVSDAGRIVWDSPVEHVATFSSAAPELALTPTPFGVTIAERTWPFMWVEVGADSRVLSHGRIDAGTPQLLRASEFSSCDTVNPHWDCYSEPEGYCPDHCPAGVPGCFGW